MLEADDGTHSDPSRRTGTGGTMQRKTFIVSAIRNAPTATFENSDCTLFTGDGTAETLPYIASTYESCGHGALPHRACIRLHDNPHACRIGLGIGLGNGLRRAPFDQRDFHGVVHDQT